MTLQEKLEAERDLLRQIQETKNQIKRTKSAMRKKQLARHVHKLENKWRKEFG